MAKIKFGKALVFGSDYLVTKAEEIDNTLVISCADAHQLQRIEIPKAILERCVTKKEIHPKYRDRLTLFSVGLNDCYGDDDFENRHFFASFLLAAKVNGKEWLRVPEHKAFSIPFNENVY